MTRHLNLDDIQGNIVRSYGRYSFPFARYFFLNISDAEKGRRFVDTVRPRITTAALWTPESKPKVTLNIGFTFLGLHALGLPTRTLQGMPESFIDGMKARAFILGDRHQNKTEADDLAWCAHWDPIWQANREGRGDDVHVWLSMNAQLLAPGTDTPVPELDQQTEWLRGVCRELGDGVRILGGHGRQGDQDYQAGAAVFVELGGRKFPTPREHFGLTDGIGDPVFEGQYPPEKEKVAVIGRGKWMDASKGWEPLATGEFILGHPDESQELPPTAMPPNLMRNGSFMVYRKLHENVASFNAVVAAEAASFAKVMGIGEDEAAETIKAKMVGRWTDGIPLMVAPTFADWRKLRAEKGMDDPDPFKAMQAQRDYLASPEASDFRYGNDMAGYRCPVGSHLRRVNTRDYLAPRNSRTGENPAATTRLNKRRRILRRGLPYGPAYADRQDDETEQGVAMMVIGASIFRQFEFIQQQWIQYGLDFNEGNNTCPLLGNHDTHKRHTIASDPESGKPPFIMSRLKTFVEARGGDYFFLPSLTGLHMIALGIVDPT